MASIPTISPARFRRNKSQFQIRSFKENAELTRLLCLTEDKKRRRTGRCFKSRFSLNFGVESRLSFVEDISWMQRGAQRKRVSDRGRGDPAGKWLTECLSQAPIDPVREFSPHGRLPRLDLGIEWTSAWEEFWSSVGGFFAGPRAPKDSELPTDSDLRIDWVRGKNSGWAFGVGAG